MKHCCITETYFWNDCLIFCSVVHHIRGKFKTCHLVIWRYVLQLLQLVRLEKKAFLDHYRPTGLWWYIQLAASLIFLLPGTSQCIRVSTHLPSQRVILFLQRQRMSTDFLCPFLIKFRPAKCFFRFSSHLTSALYSSGKRWIYLCVPVNQNFSCSL